MGPLLTGGAGGETSAPTATKGCSKIWAKILGALTLVSPDATIEKHRPILVRPRPSGVRAYGLSTLAFHWPRQGTPMAPSGSLRLKAVEWKSQNVSFEMKRLSLSFIPDLRRRATRGPHLNGPDLRRPAVLPDGAPHSFSEAVSSLNVDFGAPGLPLP